MDRVLMDVKKSAVLTPTALLWTAAHVLAMHVWTQSAALMTTALMANALITNVKSVKKSAALIRTVQLARHVLMGFVRNLVLLMETAQVQNAAHVRANGVRIQSAARMRIVRTLPTCSAVSA